MICESVQRGLLSSAYDVGRYICFSQIFIHILDAKLYRYAPLVEMADHVFHQELAKQLRSELRQN